LHFNTHIIHPMFYHYRSTIHLCFQMTGGQSGWEVLDLDFLDWNTGVSTTCLGCVVNTNRATASFSISSKRPYMSSCAGASTCSRRQSFNTIYGPPCHSSP
jgi:hypothetical protein